MFEKVLIANRGAIAVRIMRSLRALGSRSVAVYSEADLASRHVALADEAVSLGEGGPAQTYLDARELLRIASRVGAQAIHPGYGFLSENADFAQHCMDAGIEFLGPTPSQMRAFGLKHRARELAQMSGMPLLPGTGLMKNAAEAVKQAREIGFPVMLKSTAGGGGIGMRVCRDAGELVEQFEAVQRLGKNNFGDAGVFLEKYIERARHIEVQIFGDGRGEVIALGERCCSVQRRNQKVIEETPAPNLPDTVRQAMREHAVRLAQSVNYRSAGTVEYVYDAQAEQFYFLEVNTRLQVEHGVTEQVYGVDIVQWMLQLGAGELPPLSQLAAGLTASGHAVQARLYAEDPGKDFQPSPGLLVQAQFPPADGRALRIDTWVENGVEIPPYFDPMIAKLIAWAPTRQAAIAGLDQALAQSRLYGVETNRLYLRQILASAPFVSGEPWTRCLEQLPYHAPTVDVLAPGTQTTVQDLPGRLGYWDVGIPPSGPMDDRSFRRANALLGNPDGAPGLEITLSGPSLRFNLATRVAVCGAALPLQLDGVEQPMDRVLEIPAGATLSLGRITGDGARAYLAVAGGFDVPAYLGSRSTFTLGQFGGHAGRALMAGDVLHVAGTMQGASAALAGPKPAPLAISRTERAAFDGSSPLAAEAAPQGPEIGAPPDPFTPAAAANDPALIATPGADDEAHAKRLRVIYGPHGAPEYFTPGYIEQFFAAEWEVHFNSSRTGVRLIGPKPQWTREDGGEAGLHPSNLHDNAYAIGAVDFTGDMPVILGPDGPSLGGFVCPVTIIQADLWKLGQLKAGDKLRFVPVAHDATSAVAATALPSPILLDQGEGDQRLCARIAGDAYLLLEFGEPRIDLATRFRADALMTAFLQDKPDGVIDVTPGIRSLQIHFDGTRVSRAALLQQLCALWQRYSRATDLKLASRIVHLPLSWDDPQTRLAIEKYHTTVRPNAPWCPSNIEFIRRINGLDSIDQVRDIVFNASYLVLGLGDVYLGAPVATPLDPRHRLVTTKYNPARTWTPENAVGIGGAYLCVYGMEGPGGYQFVGRTLQMWNRKRGLGNGDPAAASHQSPVADHPLPQLDAFGDQPYLLRFFDQIRFYEVSAEELLQIRREFPLGRYPLRIEETELSLADYARFLSEQADGITAFKNRQQAAFDAERQRWIETGQAHFEANDQASVETDEIVLEDFETGVYAPVSGNLWQLKVKPGQKIEAGETVAVLEAMKMEIQIQSPAAGVVARIFVQAGSPLRAGQLVMALDN